MDIHLKEPKSEQGQAITAVYICLNAECSICVDLCGQTCTCIVSACACVSARAVGSAPLVTNSSISEHGAAADLCLLSYCILQLLVVDMTKKKKNGKFD